MCAPQVLGNLTARTIQRKILPTYSRARVRRLSLRRSSHAISAFVCGLDVHKETTYATILGPEGEIVAQRRMHNEEVPTFLRPHPVERVAMEASTSIAPLYRRLTEEGYQVTVSHPRKTRYIAEAPLTKNRR